MQTTYQTESKQEQHAHLNPAHVDYFSVRWLNKYEGTYQVLARLTDEGRAEINHYDNFIDARAYNQFDSAKEARAFCREFYPGMTVQRD